MLIVSRKGPDDLERWLSTEAGFLEGLCRFEGNQVRLEHYQRRFLNTRDRFRLSEKARQTGYSWIIAAEALARCHLRKHHTAIFVSYNLTDSKEKIAYARQLFMEMPTAYQRRLIVDSKTELAFESHGGGGGISRIISNPSRAPRGKKGDVYLDELAHCANDREVYRGSTAVIVRSDGQATLCSTPLGRRGIFYEIASNANGSYSGFSRQSVPWWLCPALCQDVPGAARAAREMSTADRVGRFGSGVLRAQLDSMPIEDFQQEFECRYLSDSGSFFPYGLMLACQNPELELPDDLSMIREARGMVVAGYDIGRRVNSSALSVFDLRDDGSAWPLFIKDYDGAGFDAQKTTLHELMRSVNVHRLRIDKTGIGMQLAEEMEDEYPDQVEGVNFMIRTKRAMVLDTKIMASRRQLVIPGDRGLAAEFHSVKRRITDNGNEVFESDIRGDGHADRFWSIALALMKDRAGHANEDPPEVSIRVVSAAA